MTRVLIVRLGALGDIVHALPAAAALREAFPAARIDWLVDAKHRALLDLVPVIDMRIDVDSRAWSGPRAPLAVVRELRRTQYDVALDLQGLIKSAAFARASGARRVIGYTRPHLREEAARFFYTEQVDASGDAAGDTLHVVYKSLAALRALNLPIDAAPRFPLSEPASHVPACTRQLLGLSPDEPFVLINPGAAWPNKRWPAERFGALAREIRARHGWKSAVLWGPGEETLAAQVASSSSGAADMAPATSLADLVALARAARLLISGDTGPIHLAAAVGTPVVGIYGPTDPRRNGPWDAHDVCVSRFTPCACHHQRRCRVARWCLADIEVAEVVDAVERRLRSDS
jgi:lipopolysaccharide heptosyltransferase I